MIKDPIIILVEPQIGENIGAAARAMLNCGLTQLRLVNPREKWPNEKAYAMAVGADSVLDNALVFSTYDEAVHDCHYVYATTARARDIEKKVFHPEETMSHIIETTLQDEQVAFVFGPERTGINNDIVSVSDSLITIPVNPEFSSLNLAQAVMVLCYLWSREKGQYTKAAIKQKEHKPASKESLLYFLTHLDQQLETFDFYKTDEKKPSLKRKIKNLFTRAQPNEHELGILHGIISAISQNQKK